MSEPSHINGYELCSRVLAATGGDALALLELADGIETDWLEREQASGPLPHGRDGYYLELVGAVIALANTHGGCVLLGVDNGGRALGLDAIDFQSKRGTEGWDAFLRYLVEAVFHRAFGWKRKKGGMITVHGGMPHGMYDLQRATLG